MSSEKKNFYGKEVTDAIKKACDEFGVAQEKLDIEVVETGSTGIFGLIRKKAYIKATLKTVAVEEEVAKEVVEPRPQKAPSVQRAPGELEEDVSEGAEEDIHLEEGEESEDTGDDLPEIAHVLLDTEEGQISLENLDIVQSELSRLLELMGYPSQVQTESSGISVHCCIQGGFEEALTGQDGKT